MQLILQPCSDADARGHFVDTIQNPVPVRRVLPFLRPEEAASIEATFSNAVAVWGVTPGKKDVNAKKWQRITLGDTALLYREKNFFFRGTVAYKTHCPALARDLWQSKDDGTTWEYVFFLTDLEPIDIDIARFNTAAGYKPTNIVQGFNVLDHERSGAILEALDLDPGVGAMAYEDGDIETAKKALDALAGDLDLPAAARRRAEQGHLRAILLSRKKFETCSICSKELPVDLLVVGHIRKRHACDHSQRKDLANVMPVCLLGCDCLFENGYVHVDSQGIIREEHGAGASANLKAATKLLVGRPCKAWSPTSEPYFRWHREHPRKFV